jgi:sulfatase maturation enzyme AslB (radical SAM superfamily)
MSEAVLNEMMRQFMEQPVSDLSVGWQGGEPTLWVSPSRIQLMWLALIP